MKTTKTKQFWSLLLALCMVLALMPPAQAYFDDAEFSVELNYILKGESSENYLVPGDSVSVGDTIVVYPKQQDQYLDVSVFYYDWQVEQPDGMFMTVLASSSDIIGDNRLTITEEMAGKSMRVYVYWDFEYPDTDMEVYSPQWNVDLPITEDYFPDPNFRAYVLTLPGADDTMFTAEELAAIHTISCFGEYYLTESERIHDMTGLTYFTALTALHCEDQRLTELDLSQNPALTNLSCSSNRLTALDVSQNPKLKELFCDDNALTELDLSQNPDLLIVSCAKNQLVELDLSMNAHMETVDIEDNQRTAYDGMPLTELSTKLDPERVSNVTGGSFEDGVIHFTEETLTYTYDLGRGFLKTFTLIPSEPPKVLAIDEENFPDENFRAYVLTLSGAENGTFTDEEIAAITSISCPGKGDLPENERIRDLTGIEHFTELIQLDCGNQLITDLDVRALPKLQGLYCYDNPLTELDVTQNPALERLVCAGTKLKELDLSQNPELNFLECSLTPLTALDLSGNKKLEDLSCSESALAQIDLSQNAALITLRLDENQLTELDVSHNPDLYALYCDANHLVELDLSQNPKLEVLNCFDNVREVSEGTLLSDLSPRFDVEKVAEVTGGSFDGGKVHFTEDTLTYFYTVSPDTFAEFTLVPNTEIPAPEFSDVDEDDWFYDSVLWAIQMGVTNGYTDGTFRPKNVCMRREVVTFLWNTHGKPEVTDLTNPFKDVKDGQWYTQPILWAVQKGITSGKGSPDLFAPKDNVMRREFVAFLWRAKGCPEPTIALKDTPFTDVKDGQWYTKPILWAYENGITNGKGHADTFAPKDTCTRAEIVTFLSRAYAE